jgi:predicted DNA-binding transcriptional regulator AlpA
MRINPIRTVVMADLPRPIKVAFESEPGCIAGSGTTGRANNCGGISESTWRAYVSDGFAPQPLPGYDERRRQRWDADEVRAWHANRPRARTDLKERKQ